MIKAFLGYYLKTVSILYVIAGIIGLIGCFYSPIFAGAPALLIMPLVVSPAALIAPLFNWGDGSVCPDNIPHLVNSLCNSFDAHRSLIIGLFVLAIIFGILAFNAVNWIKSHNSFGHFVWILMVILSFFFVYLNYLFYTDDPTQALPGLFWATSYLIVYLILTFNVN